VAVTHVGGDRWFGTWEARSLDASAAVKPAWKVEIRSLAERINHCTCPDFATNRLGTCKHVEAVLHHLKKKGPKKFERLAAEGPSTSFVHLDWSCPEPPEIRLRRGTADPPDWLDEHFDAEGRLRDALPDALHRLQQAARRNGGLTVTSDAAQYAVRFTEEAERRKSAAALAEEIRASDGQLPGIRARLYPYQVEGVAFLAASRRALLADDMGLGKTLQAITAAAVLHRYRGLERALVVCPASLKHQWAREVERFAGLESTRRRVRRSTAAARRSR
jgi:hypothetical protein